MNKNMIKIAIVCNNLEINGISNVIMNYLERIDLKKFEITIFAGSSINNEYEKICKRKNIKIIVLPHKSRKLKYYYNLLKKMDKNRYDILHVHGNSESMFIELLIGKIKKINKRIAHCHTANTHNSFISKVSKLIFNHLYTDAFACGKLVGQNLYNNRKFYIMTNGIEIKKYKYDEDKRNKIRNQLKINDKIVLGHIGRFNLSKNHPFLIEIFEKISKVNDRCVLLLVGDGPDFNKIKTIVDNSKYKDKIILYGETNTPENLYSSMDFFIFPSKFEGFPLTLIEAQISGLKCIISDNITEEINISDNIIRLPIDNSSLWKENIINCIKENNIDRTKYYLKNIKNFKKYDINECVKEVEKKYTEISK